MTTIKDGGPAFPRTGFAGDADARGFGDTQPQDGMTLRDYFAGQVLGQMIGWCQTDEGWDPRDVAENAYQLADAMLVAREAQP